MQLTGSHSPRLNRTIHKNAPLCAYSRGQVCIHAYSVYPGLDAATGHARRLIQLPRLRKLLKGEPATRENVSRIEFLRVTPKDPALSLFECYRSMFALRNIGTDGVGNPSASGFLDYSALFKFISRDTHKLLSLTSGLLTRHEIAFVFG